MGRISFARAAQRVQVVVVAINIDGQIVEIFKSVYTSQRNWEIDPICIEFVLKKSSLLKS